jgi:two-component system, NarL family, nitrate/nitrite response regulator NarL
VRVLVVGADALARAGLMALLARREELVMLGEALPSEVGRSLRDAEVLLWDAGPEGVAGELPEELPSVVLVAGERQAAAALSAGARGVLRRDAPPERIAAALHAASAGLFGVDEALAGSLLRRTAAVEPLVEPLTPREHEVLVLLAEGLANKALALRLGITESTAKFHVNAILGKLGVESRAEAIVQALRLGLVAL